MTRAWVRDHAINNNRFGYYGYWPLTIINPGQTVLRTLWSVSLWGLWGSLDTFPPGSSICRAGLIAWDALDTSPPTPITNVGDDWMDLVTLNPVGQIATSVNVDWSYQWNTGSTDRDVTVHRKNAGPTGSLNLYVSWEFDVASDAVSGFGINGWNCAADAYINSEP